MKPSPFRLQALLDHRTSEKDRAARALAVATQSHSAALSALADSDACDARARDVIRAATTGTASAALREAYAALERSAIARPRIVERVRAEAENCAAHATLHAQAVRSWKALAVLEGKAAAAQRAYQEQCEESELGEANVAVADFRRHVRFTEQERATSRDDFAL